LQKHSKITNRNLIGVDFDWHFSIKKRTEKVIVHKTQTFKIDEAETGSQQPTPLNVNYDVKNVGEAENKDGTSLSSSIEPLKRNKDYSIISVTLKTKRNDNGGDAFYKVKVGDLTTNHQNKNLETKYETSSIKSSTLVDVRLIDQNSGYLDQYDSCNGYTMFITGRFREIKEVKKWKLSFTDY